MTVVNGTIVRPNGNLPSGTASFKLVGEGGRFLDSAFYPAQNQTIEGSSTATVTAGAYSVTLASNDLLIPAGTRWARFFGGNPVYLYVPTTGPVNEEDIVSDPPASIQSAALSVHAADDDEHGGGQELWVAVKSDATFVTSSGTGAVVTGWAATDLVPGRSWEIDAAVEALGSSSTEGGSLDLYINLPISAISRTSNVVTATLPTGHGVQTGAPVIADVADATFDGGFVVTGSAATTVTWAQTAANDPDGGTGTLSVRVGVTSSWRGAVATLRPYARFPDLWWQPATGLQYTAQPRFRSSAGDATLLSGTFFGSPSQAVMTAATR